MKNEANAIPQNANMSVVFYCPAPIPYVRDDFRTPSNRYDEDFFAKITKGKKRFYLNVAQYPKLKLTIYVSEI